MFLFAFIAGAPTLVFSDMLTLENRVVEHRYPNGILLLMVERHFSPTVAVRMMFSVGAVDEVGGKTGLAHMFEHMMFKGTRTIGTRNYQAEAPLLAQIDRLYTELDHEKAKLGKADQARVAKLIEQIHEAEKQESEWVIVNELGDIYEKEGGTGFNAATSHDWTQYMVELPSNKLPLWALVDSDRIKNPVFRQFYQEREVVKEERRLRTDTNPNGKLYENFLGAAFVAHPYRNPVIGWASDIDHLTVADLSDFYHRHYTPDRLTIVIVGDIKTPEVISLVNHHFGNWQPPKPGPSSVPTAEPLQEGPKRIVLQADAQPQLLMSYHIPAYPHPNHPVFYAVAQLLSGGSTSRLEKSLVEKKRLVTSVDTSSGEPGERFDGLFVISSNPRYPHTAADVERAIRQEIDRLKKQTIETWELEKVRAAVDMKLLSILQTNGGMASTLVYDQSVYGDWRHLIRMQKSIPLITAQDIQRVVQTIFTPANETVATLEPKKK